MRRKILISGAGIAGLTAALWFERQGYTPVVVERADKPRGGGFLVSLSHFAYQYADELGVLADMHTRDMGITHSSYHDIHGHSLLKLSYQRLFRGVDVLQIMRDDVVDVLYQQAKNRLEICFGDTITNTSSLRDKPLVQFASGTEAEYDLLVIAEGQNSGTRDLTTELPVEIDYLGLHCAAVRLPNVLGIEHKFETHMDLGRYMAVFTTPAGDLGSVFVWASESHDLPVPADRRSKLRDAFGNAGPVITRVLNHLPEDRIYFDTLKQIRATSWVNGRSVLLGDAAHCLTLFSGRGAAAAITGATRLARALARHDNIDLGLASYEKESRAIIDPIQAETRKAVDWYVPKTRTKQFVRDQAMRYVPDQLFEYYFQRKYSNV